MHIRAVVCLLGLAFASTFSASISGQPSLQSVIVVFHDDAPFRSFPAARPDARARANPAAWNYLDRAVLGTVHVLERQYGFRSEHAYSATVRGFAARLSAAQIEALNRDPLVAFIEPDGTLRSFEQVLPWGIDRIDADVSSARSGDGVGAITNVNVYVLDNGIDRTHPELNVVNHVNFTSAANAATCAHGTR